MAEDNNALFHWPSTWKWHHKVKNNNKDHFHATGSHGLRIKIIGPSPPNNNNSNNNVQCHVCNQGFTSAKSLGGHMRIHSLSRKRKVSPCVEKPSCYICGKTFSSDKSLFGHMRVHPESVRKGIETPTSFDSSESLWGRSPTGKRSCRRNKGLEQGFQVDSLMQEAAYTLMLMSKGKNLGDEVASDHVDLVPPSTKKRRRIEQKSLAMVGNEKGSFQSHDGRSNQIMDQFGSYLSTPDHMQHYANNTTMQVGGIKATAEEEHDQANRAKTQSKEKGQNRFQIFIGHYQPPTMDKGKGIQPDVVVSACVMASSTFGL